MERAVYDRAHRVGGVGTHEKNLDLCGDAWDDPDVRHTGRQGRTVARQGDRTRVDHLRLLRQRNCMIFDVNDGVTDDIQAAEAISERVRFQITAALENLHAMVRSGDESLDTQRPELVRKHLHSREFARQSGFSKPAYALADAAAALVDELRDSRVNLGLSQIRFYDNHLFEHSVSTTIAATILGRELDWNKDTLIELAVGSLMHDLGEIFIDRDILAKPGELTPEELELVKLHPQIGYEAVRQIFGPGTLSNHVPFQHHERQDGTGYPRGLRGTNGTLSPSARGLPGHILPIAQVAAVADAYDTLNSENPYRQSVGPDKVAEILADMAGGKLNAALVERFLTVLELYPPGTEVLLHGPGGLEGCVGVVVRCGLQDLSRALVRMLYDGTGRKLKLFGLALEDHTELTIESTLTLAMGAAGPTDQGRGAS
ncbi:MAG: HD domain-containing protein [Dehalococcoidia bacterium]|nr:HD domain-containing protein [Dehalococcoidia bacterium]